MIPAFLNYITVLDGLSPSVKTSLLRGQFALRLSRDVASSMAMISRDGVVTIFGNLQGIPTIFFSFMAAWEIWSSS